MIEENAKILVVSQRQSCNSSSSHAVSLEIGFVFMTEISNFKPVYLKS